MTQPSPDLEIDQYEAVTDQRPPRYVSDERTTVLALLQYQRESFVRKISGVDDAAARRRLVASDTTLLWLTQHLAFAETLWIAHRFAGESNTALPDTDDNEKISDAAARYQNTWRHVDAIIAAASLEDLCRNLGDDPPVNLRWVLMHLLEETARHAGHADILRELVDGATGR